MNTLPDSFTPNDGRFGRAHRMAIGDERLTDWATQRRKGGTLLHGITPTGSCRDRLAAFYHF